MTVLIFYLLGILAVLFIFELRYRLRKDQWPSVLPSRAAAKCGESPDTSKSVLVAAPGADSHTTVSKYRKVA